MPANRSGAKPVKSKPVALQKIDAAVRIRGLFAETWLTFVFYNSEKANIEASFCFPLAEDAAVCEMRYAIDNSLQNAQYDDSETAFDAYDCALEKGDTSFLVENLEQDILSVSVGNLQPGKQAEVKIKIVGLLREIDDSYRFELPLFLTPRYVPYELDWAENHVPSPTFVSHAPYELSIRVNVRDIPYKQLRSPSHLLEIHSKTPDGGCKLIASDKGIFDCGSFVLDLEVDDTLLPFCGAGLHPDGTQALLLMMKPEFEFPPECNTASHELIFMLDCSDSMQGDYFKMAVKSLELSLRWLTPGCYFNICLYGDEFSFLFKESVAYDQNSLMSAVEMLEDATPDLGGSELKDAIGQAFSRFTMDDMEQEIILFTDGDVYNTGDIIEYVKDNASGARFYTFGIGTDSPQQLTRGLAKATGGLCEILEPYDHAEEKVLRQLCRIFQPRVNDLTFSVSDAEIEFSNNHVTVIYDGDTIMVSGKVKQLGSNPELIVHGRIGERLLAWKFAIVDLGSNELVPALASGLAQTPDVVNSNRSLVAVVPATDDDSYYPSYRPVPIINKGNGNRVGTRSLIHEVAASYGESIMDILHRQHADGSFGDIESTKAAVLRLKRAEKEQKYLKASIIKAERLIQKQTLENSTQ